MNRARGLLGFLLCVSISMIPSGLRADSLIKEKSHTDGYKMMGQSVPAKDEVFNTWLANDRCRVDTGAEASTILRLDKNMIYVIDHAKKTYAEMPVTALQTIVQQSVEKAAEQEGLSEQEKTQASAMAAFASGLMRVDATVTSTSDQKKIGNWDSKKYLLAMKMAMGQVDSEVWCSEDVKVDYAVYQAAVNQAMFQQQGWEQTLQELKKMKGFPVLTLSTNKVMGKTFASSRELVEVKDGTAPAGTYDIPEGYKKVTSAQPE